MSHYNHNNNKSKIRSAFELFFHNFSTSNFVQLVATNTLMWMFYILMTMNATLRMNAIAKLIVTQPSLSDPFLFIGKSILWVTAQTIFGFYLPKKLFKEPLTFTLLLTIIQSFCSHEFKTYTSFSYMFHFMARMHYSIEAATLLTDLYKRTDNPYLVAINLFYFNLVNSCCGYIAALVCFLYVRLIFFLAK